MPKILVADKLSEAGLNVFLRHEQLEVHTKSGLSPDELKLEIPTYDALVVRSSAKVTAEVIDAAENLKVIGRAGIGVDNIDLDAATLRGIVVMNTPQANAIAAAEHTISLLMALARNIPQAAASMKAGLWEKSKFVGAEVYDKTLGIIGLGHIGRIVAELATGLKMHVIACDPHITREAAAAMGIPRVSFEQLLGSSDFVSLHIPRTKETENMIDAEALAKMPPGSMLINCARGGIINEADLYEALTSGHLGGAALDVFETEPAIDNPLCKLDNVICTPHLGASTIEAQEGVAVAVAEQICEYLLHNTMRNAVNVPTVSKELMEHIGPYMNLGEKMGNFVMQITDFPVEEIVIEYQGKVVEHGVGPITSGVLKGVFTPVIGNSINIINARAIARKRGVRVREATSHGAEDFVSLVSIRLLGGDKENYVAGSIFGKREPRIVRFNDFPIEAVPSGNMLFIYNDDRPGVIGDIGAALARGKVNIATMYLGRDRAGGRAVSLWQIDAPVTKEIAAEIAALPNIISVKRVEL